MVSKYSSLTLLYYVQLVFQYLQFRIKQAVAPRARFLFCCYCTERRLLNFATINIIMATIMIAFGLWDSVLGLFGSDSSRWKDAPIYAVADGISIILAIETIVIYFKFP